MNEKQRHNLVLALISISILVPFFGVGLPETYDSSSIYRYLLSSLGYSGLMLLVWQFALGTRSVSGLFFKNLPSKISLHKWLGKYGVLLIFLHPIFAMLTYGENLMYVFVPSLESEFAKHVTLGRMALISLLIVWVTSALVRGKIKYRPWKYVHYISYPALGLSLLHIMQTQTSFDKPVMYGYWVFCTIATLAIIGLRARHLFGYSKRIYKVVNNEKITPEAYLLRLKADGKSIKNVEPGQYVYLQLKLTGEEHPFSVLDVNKQSGELLIGYKVYGKFTARLADLKPTTNIILDGGYGDFTPSREEKPIIFIAGGIGITPFVHRLLNSTNDILFYGNKSPEMAAFGTKLKQAIGNRLINVYSSTDQAKQLPNTEYGNITTDLIKKYIAEPKDYAYYICGPKQLATSLMKDLDSLGVNKQQIHSEVFAY